LFSFPLSEQQIQILTENDIDTFIQLDRHGIFYGKNETFGQFKNRLISLYAELKSLYEAVNSKKPVIIHRILIKPNNLIDNSSFTDACRITENYSFSIDWTPGFFAEKSINFFAGGFTMISDTGLPIFILKSNFKGKKKWFIYTLTELLSHELCHVARYPLFDKHYEEFFAYKLSPSRFRRCFGSLFHSPEDSIFMLIPFFLLLIVVLINTFIYLGINELYFWILSLIYPIFLFARNFHYKRIYTAAYKTIVGLVKDKITADSILFRCSAKEIKIISKFSNSDTEDLKFQLKRFSQNNIRWKVILKRFLLM